MSDFTSIISKLLKEVETDLGAEKMAHMFVASFSEAINHLECVDKNWLKKQLRSFIETIHNCKPKYARLLDICYHLWGEIDEMDEENDDLKSAIIAALADIESDMTESMETLSNYGVSEIQDGDVILTMNKSMSVVNTLVKARKLGVKFDVIVVEYTAEKVDDIAEQLEKADISFSAVQLCSLSHVIDQCNKVFIGSVTYLYSNDIVTGSGFAGLVAIAHSHKIPVHVFMTTNKFSLWKATAAEIALRTHREKLAAKNNYNHITFSHDRIDVNYFDSIVTERGIYSTKQLKNLYDKKYVERKKIRKDVLGIEA